MTTETMTIHEALATLKIIDDRISSAISEAEFVGVKKVRSEFVNRVSVGKFIAKAEASLQKITDLIARRNALKKAVSLSNAATKVTIGGKEYTVAEAIEMRKSGLENTAYLMRRMADSYSTAKRKVESENAAVEAKADPYVASLFGGKEKVSAEEATPAREAYIKSNEMEFVAISDIEEKIDKLRTEYDTFMAEVDAKLSISNALTTITIEY